MPLAPWVFGSVTVAFTTLPAHGIGPVAGLQVAVPGLLAALALAAGYGVQSVGRRLHAATTARHGDGRVAAAAGLAVVVLGCLASASATAQPGLPTAALAAALLGAGYGLCLSTGLREVEETAAPEELGAVVSIFYSLAYAGLWCPTCSRSWRRESVTPGRSPQPLPRRDSPWCLCSCRDPARVPRLAPFPPMTIGHGTSEPDKTAQVPDRSRLRTGLIPPPASRAGMEMSRCSASGASWPIQRG